MKAASKKLVQQFAIIRDLLSVLGQDTAFCLAKLDDELGRPEISEADISQLNFWLKAAVRTFLAQVEGLSYAMRWFVVRAAEEGVIQIDLKILAQLQERKYDKETGELGQHFHGNFDENFKNAFRYFPLVFGCDWSPKFQGSGWDKFRRVAAARNDFTHPKSTGHLFQGGIGEDIHGAVAWFGNSFNEVLSAIGKRLGKEFKFRSIEVPNLPNRHKLSLIKPPESDGLEAVSRETEFMALSREDGNRAFRVFMDGATARGGILAIPKLSPTGGRLFIRALFTDIEAMGYMANRLLEDSIAKEEISFSDEERELLSTRQLTFKVAHIAEAFSRKFGRDRTVERSGRLWEAFCQIAEVRDRITHPKDAAHVDINVDMLTLLSDAFAWYEQMLDAIELTDKFVDLKVRVK